MLLPMRVFLQDKKICYIETRSNNFTKIEILGPEKKTFSKYFSQILKTFFFYFSKKSCKLPNLKKKCNLEKCFYLIVFWMKVALIDKK